MAIPTPPTKSCKCPPPVPKLPHLGGAAEPQLQHSLAVLHAGAFDGFDVFELSQASGLQTKVLSDPSICPGGVLTPLDPPTLASLLVICRMPFGPMTRSTVMFHPCCAWDRGKMHILGGFSPNPFLPSPL